ncbi:exonuclease 3'-5' domain-containing protein 2-like [Montipora foliosa]|uniref:exonuclease 3'-5' domain-containing protein 2-like n=1 Tax=Montipora foliosa TaxID=591990 RepID=UPI0035F1E438
MEEMGESTTGNVSKKVNVDHKCLNDHENTSPIKLNKGHKKSFYSLVICFVAFLQWFLQILFFGPDEHIRKRSSICFSQETERSKEPKNARVFVLDDASSCDTLLQYHRSQYPFRMNYLGIDCEWVNTKGQVNAPVALLQIATPICDCFLVRLCKMEGQMPQILEEILQDKTILKFGVGIQDDVKRLSAMFGINVLGCVDLRHVVQSCQMGTDDQKSFQKMSLDALAKKILGVRMDKSWRIRCSNWEAAEFSVRQIEYAMNDALVASHIFLRLVNIKTRHNKDERGIYDSLGFCPVNENHFETENDCNSQGACHKFEHTEQSLCVLNNCDVENNKTDFTLNQSGDSPEHCLPDQEPAYKQHLDTFRLESLKNKNPMQEGLNFGNISDDKFIRDRLALKEALCGDSKICYEATVDLNKFESPEMEGYLFMDEVTNFLRDPCFTQRAGSLCQGVVDIAFRGKKKNFVSNDEDEKDEFSSCSAEKRPKPYKKGTTRKTPLYMNCMLAAPDGSRLCTLDRKKADWYIERGIGHLTSLDPYTVQLNFEPAGRPGTEDYYYLNFKDNVCVVCGSDESYMRKNVVPHDYRRHFPLVMKDHHSHDILLTCRKCHCLANHHDDQLRKELAIKYNAPLGNAAVCRLVEDPVLKKVKSAARALNYAGNKIPEDRRQELSIIVQKYFNAPVLTQEIIMQAAAMETRKENANFVSHGREVVKRVREEGKLLEFEKMWRKHFVDTMHPKYLPPLWSVDHRHEALKEKLGLTIMMDT